VISKHRGALGYYRLCQQNASSRLNIGFIEQIQQRLAIMTIRRSGLNRHHQTIAIDRRVLLIAK